MLHQHARPAVAGSYTLGAICGAVTTASVLLVLGGLLSPIPADLRAGAALCGLALLALHAVRILCLDLPQRTYQIPRETFRSAPTTAAFRFAFELGTGVRTYITSTAPYALCLVMLLVMPSTLGAAVIATSAAAVGYGLGRSVVVASQSITSSAAVEHPDRWLRAADLLAVTGAVALAARALF